MYLCGASGLTDRKQAYLLLERAVRLHWGLQPLPALERGERGKPFFPQHPELQFNLSHSGGYALCALSDRPVGVDIQVLRPTWPPRLVERSCTPAERAWLRGRGDVPEDFAALWSCKESVGKESGYGLPYPPLRLEIPLSEAKPSAAGGFTCALGARYLRVYAGPDWRGAVCAWEPPPKEIFWFPRL